MLENAKANTSHGNFKRAIKQYHQALEDDPTSAQAYVGLAIALCHQSHYDEARASCQRALELDPLLALAHSTLGSIWLQQGKLAEAEQELETAIRLGPHLAASYISLAAVHIEREELQKAETELKQALTEDVQSSSAYHNLGLVRFKQGRYDDAIKAVRKAFGIKPTREDAVVLAGLYYAKYKWLAALLAGSALLVAYTVHSLWTIAVIAIPILGMLFLAIGTLKEVDRRHGLVQLLWALFLAMLYVSGIILNW